MATHLDTFFLHPPHKPNTFTNLLLDNDKDYNTKYTIVLNAGLHLTMLVLLQAYPFSHIQSLALQATEHTLWQIGSFQPLDIMTILQSWDTVWLKDIGYSNICLIEVPEFLSDRETPQNNSDINIPFQAFETFSSWEHIEADHYIIFKDSVSICASMTVCRMKGS